MNREERLKDWVASRHEGQLIKRTSAPYIDHLLAVAEMAKPVVRLGWEIGLCHDLLEDTATTEMELQQALASFGYANGDVNLITSCVIELTDVYTAEAYPKLRKSERKKYESSRLLTISSPSQSVKYGDLIYNIGWMLKYDRKDAKRYLLKKQLLLANLNRGDQGLLQQALRLIDSGIKSLMRGKRKKI